MTSPARRLVEERIAALTEELDTLFAGSRENARRESAEQLNQAVRRLRIAGDAGELMGTLENAAAQFAPNAVIFRIEDGAARRDAMDLNLAGAPALAAAVESREPQTAATTASEVSQILVDAFAHAPGERASIFPVEAGERVVAIIYTWGAVQGPAIELLAQVAGVLYPLPEPAPPEPEAARGDLIQIAPGSPPAQPKSAWESLPVEEQRIHLRAQRFARVKISEMRLYDADLLQTGRTRRDLYSALRQPIDAARGTFREEFFSSCPSMVDYLHLELLHTLANDNTDLLGNDYPGPLV
ncbi:MAG TPA: hypothetical protein VMH28_28855 [Candidatus Acidoferrales bacterium]|nr:hypothetical protein [Candidatus Acidoferrales bacterium]